MKEETLKDDPLVPITIRKPKSVRARFLGTATLRGTTAQQLIGDFVDAYLDERLQNFNRTNPEVMGPIVREESYNSDQWLAIAEELLNHPKPGLASTLRGVLVQLQDSARYWDGLQGTEDHSTGEDQPGGNESRSGGLGALDEATERLKRSAKDFDRSRKEAHGKKRRSSEENRGGR